jgi:hypothetical protein
MHGDRTLAQRAEDTVDGIVEQPHDKTVKQGHPAPAAGTGEDPPPRQKGEIA